MLRLWNRKIQQQPQDMQASLNTQHTRGHLSKLV